MIQGLDDVFRTFDCAPWGATTGRRADPARRPAPLYTQEQRRRRDESRWTTVQAILAPLQFAAFLVSLALVMRFVATGTGYGDATVSILVKTGLLCTIMVTGAIWEKRVFGQYLFAPAFFWEDLFSFLVIGLHAAYVAALLTGSMPARGLMLLALSGYAAYLINATQFVLKLRTARLATVQVAG